MLERHIAVWDQAPRQAAVDGRLCQPRKSAPGKACGVRDMACHKKSGLKVEDMVKSKWVYRKLRNFRAGIEAGISCLTALPLTCVRPERSRMGDIFFP